MNIPQPYDFPDDDLYFMALRRFKSIKKYKEMTDRDFKLLVREYFKAKSKRSFAKDAQSEIAAINQQAKAEQRILKELESFTRRDVEELPFKEKEI